MSYNKFITDISAELIRSVNNNFSDNYDQYRFGDSQKKTKEVESIKTSFVSLLNKKGFYNDFNNQNFGRHVEGMEFPFSDFIYLYENLEDEYSKKVAR